MDDLQDGTLPFWSVVPDCANIVTGALSRNVAAIQEVKTFLLPSFAMLSSMIPYGCVLFSLLIQVTSHTYLIHTYLPIPFSEVEHMHPRQRTPRKYVEEC